MPTTFQTSGDLIADRRYAYAVELGAEGDHAAAAELIEQALELAPDWAAGWFGLGASRLKLGDSGGATTAFAEALRLDPADRLGAGLQLARLGARPEPDAPPEAYVRDLFDAYAGRFERALVDELGYQAPALIAVAIDRAGGAPFARALDLGCGTGLMGALLKQAASAGGAPRVGWLGGVDLAAKMVAIARAKGVYDLLQVGEIVAHLADAAPETFDLITAADVLCYLGDLAPTLAAAARALASGGLLAFSLERLAEAAADDAGAAPAWRLGEGMRYAHAAAPVIAAARAAGLELVDLTEADLRRDRGAAVAGLVVVFTKP